MLYDLDMSDICNSQFIYWASSSQGKSYSCHNSSSSDKTLTGKLRDFRVKKFENQIDDYILSPSGVLSLLALLSLTRGVTSRPSSVAPAITHNVHWVRPQSMQ